MNASPRVVLSALAVAFTAYLAVGGLVWTSRPYQPVVLVAALALYLATTWLCIFWRAQPASVYGESGETFVERRMLPAPAAALALAAAVLVPAATWFAAGDGVRTEAFATWSIGGISALMAIVVVRRRPVIAWTGVGVTAAEAIWWIGPADALALGVVGLVVWVGVAQLLSGILERAARDTAELTRVQRAACEWLASQDGRRRERRAQIQRALAITGPVLSRTIEARGRLDSDERLRARLAEGRLRDDLRGAVLLDDGVRAQLEGARRRGASVTVLDEGGLDGLDRDALAAVRWTLARTLEDARSQRIIIRTATGDDVAVTVVGRSRRHGDPFGEEQVDLWREIRPPDPERPGVRGGAPAEA